MRVVKYYPRALVGDGGMTNAVLMLSRCLVDLGVETVVLHDETARQPPSGTGIRFEAVRHRYRGAAMAGVERHLRDADVVVLHSAWTVQNVVVGAAARRMGIPYVLEPRGAYDPHIVSRRRAVKSTFWHLAERELVMRAHAVHVFFDSESEHLRRLGYRGPVVVAPNGVTVPDSFQWCGGGDHVLWLGRFDPEHKGLDLLLEALRLVPASERPALRLQGPDWRSRKTDVQGLVDSLGLRRWVTLAPQVLGDKKWRAVADAKAFVYPSRWEAFGNSLAEAAHIGVPLAATTYPLARFLAEHDAAYVAEATAGALAAVLQQVTQPAAAASGARARDLVRQTMTWPAVAATWLRQVEAVL